MSEESQVSDVECSICGHDGGPYPECQLCLGNQRFVQSRSYTLTEERQGKNPDEETRYGPMGEVGPKIAVLPGSFDPTRRTEIDKANKSSKAKRNSR